jgi:hypothetical protein
VHSEAGQHNWVAKNVAAEREVHRKGGNTAQRRRAGVVEADRDRLQLAVVKRAEGLVARLLFRQDHGRQQLRDPPHCSTNYRDHHGPVAVVAEGQVLLDPAEAAEQEIVVTLF